MWIYGTSLFLQCRTPRQEGKPQSYITSVKSHSQCYRLLLVNTDYSLRALFDWHNPFGVKPVWRIPEMHLIPIPSALYGTHIWVKWLGCRARHNTIWGWNDQEKNTPFTENLWGYPSLLTITIQDRDLQGLGSSDRDKRYLYVMGVRATRCSPMKIFRYPCASFEFFQPRCWFLRNKDLVHIKELRHFQAQYPNSLTKQRSTRSRVIF